MKEKRKSVFKASGVILLKFFFILGVVAFIFCISNGKAISSASVNIIVNTEYGRVRGFKDDNNTLAWKGIPYAEPPVDKLRWKAPHDPESWTGVRDATEDCDECIQWALDQKWQPLGYVRGNEDCLYLNIWRPQSDEMKLPVYVWIHGGSNRWGGAKAYNGSALASRSQMVVVVIQYRLGPLGWFTHPILRSGDSKDDSGNFGTLDHLKALQWVKDNIKAFGGDKNNITIAGESAGAHNVMNLLISPLAEDLFHRAISQSNGMPIVSVKDGEELANTLISALLKNDPCYSSDDWEEWSQEEKGAYLRGKDPEDLMCAAIDPNTHTMPNYCAYKDGFIIPLLEEDSLNSVIATGEYNRVPIILGSNEYEMKTFLPFFGPIVKRFICNMMPIPNPNDPNVWIPSGDYTWSNLFDVLDGKCTLDEVLPSKFDKYLYKSCGKYGSLNWKAKYVDSITRQLKEHQEDVYAYLFKWGGKGSGPYPFNFIFGPSHAMELPFFGGSDESLFGYSFTEENRAGREELQEAMMAYIAQFARTGNPNEPDSGRFIWNEWSNDPDQPKAIIFDADPNQARLSMSNEEITVQGVSNEIWQWLLLPSPWPSPYENLKKSIIGMFLWP